MNLYEPNTPDFQEMTDLANALATGTNMSINNEYMIPDIFGWMTPMELLFLYQQAKKMKSVAEIGCWKGRSTHALASACKGTVFALDHWQGSKNDLSAELAKEEDIYAIFMKNTKQFKNIVVMRGDASDSVLKFENKSIDMVFIDAGHIYEDVSRDIKNWLPKTKKLICGHDYSEQFPDVVASVHEFLGQPDGVVGTIWYKTITV